MPPPAALLKLSIPELRTRFLDGNRAVPQTLLEALESDTRHSAQELARQIQARRRKNRAEGQRLRNLLRFEEELWATGVQWIAGVDEAGMAPLAGPVVAGAVILPQRYKLKGLDDSKKILDEERREELAFQIKRDAICWGVGRAEVEEIDRINIYHAGLLAMRRALLSLSQLADFVLVDARKIPGVSIRQRGIIHGDALSMSIAAASIIAKTTRDALMAELDTVYPGYDFKSHKGYPTPEHCKQLKARGVLPIHRRSFQPVRDVLGLPPLPPPRERTHPDQKELFAELPITLKAEAAG